MKLPFRLTNSDREYYLDQCHIQLDDIAKLREERDALKPGQEQELATTMLINAQKTYIWLQGRIEN